MEDENDEIERFLDGIPEKFQVLEEGIPFEIQKEYFEYSHSFGQGFLSDQEIERLGSVLFKPDITLEGKKKALTLLAHVGSISAFKKISEYYENPDQAIKQWTALALQECRMFLESELSDENIGFISTGLGGTRDKLRVYLLVLPLADNRFNKNQLEIIEKELIQTAKNYNCEIENFDFQELYVGLTVLIPMDVAIATFIDNGIKSCNEFGNFVLEHYYAANTEIPEKNEIERIIKIVRED